MPVHQRAQPGAHTFRIAQPGQLATALPARTPLRPDQGQMQDETLVRRGLPPPVAGQYAPHGAQDGSGAAADGSGHGLSRTDDGTGTGAHGPHDGRTAARTIRALDRADAKTIPIFALSADAFVEDERLSIQSGMNGHFAKPVDFTMLQQAIGVYLAKRKRKE